MLTYNFTSLEFYLQRRKKTMTVCLRFSRDFYGKAIIYYTNTHISEMKFAYLSSLSFLAYGKPGGTKASYHKKVFKVDKDILFAEIFKRTIQRFLKLT